MTAVWGLSVNVGDVVRFGMVVHPEGLGQSITVLGGSENL
jgi:hypothetical protein